MREMSENNHRLRARTLIVWIAALLICSLVIPMQDTSAKSTMKVKLHTYGKCSASGCSAKRGDGKNDWKTLHYDGNRGEGSFRWVSFTDPVTGKKKKADAYCLQPSAHSPGAGNRTATRINPNAAKWTDLARVLSFADGGPGEKDLTRYLKEHKKSFPDFQSGKERYMMMHVTLAYAYWGEKAFQLHTSSGKTAYDTDGFKKRIKKVYRWCLNHAVFVSDAAFGFSPAAVEATFEDGEYVSEPISVTGGDQRQYFDYTVPAKTGLEVLRKGQKAVYAAGASVQIHVGDRLVFRFSSDRTTGIPRTTVTGALGKIFPYIIKASSDKQDVGFYAASNTSAAAFSVTLQKPDSGRVRVIKRKCSLTGQTSAEEESRFRLWKAEWNSYEEAEAVSGGRERFAEELVTDTDGMASSSELSTGSYWIQQVSSANGYGKMQPNPQRIEVAKDEVTVFEAEDPELGIRIRIRKTDAETGAPITDSPAVFGIYRDARCRDLADSCQTVTEGAEAGAALSGPLSAGTYYIAEKEPPEGYLRSAEVREVTLKYTAKTKRGEEEFVYEAGDWENARPEYHDVLIDKTAEDSAGEDFTFHIALAGIPEESGAEAIFSPDGSSWEHAPLRIVDAKAEVDVSIPAGGSIRLRHLPVGAEYTIREEGAEGYRPSYRVWPQAAVSCAADSGERSKGLSVSERIAPQSQVGEEGYEIHYIWDNTREVLHTLSLRKVSVGIEREESDVFTFDVVFSGTSGRVPGYVITDEKSGRAVSSQRPDWTEGDTASFEIRLKNGQKVKFTDIAPGTQYRITERASDYMPSYRVVREEGVIGKQSDAGPANRPLSTEWNVMPAGTSDASPEFLFLNTAADQHRGNVLYITKAMEEEGAEEMSFAFEADFQNLNGGEYYAFAQEGPGTYTLTADVSSAEVTDAAGEGVPGVSLLLIRPDGKRKTIATDAQGRADLQELGDWIRQKGTDMVSIEWMGGTLEEVGASPKTDRREGLRVTSFAADEEGCGKLTFALAPGGFGQISGLPPETVYSVTEKANRYEPSYEIYRVGDSQMRMLDAASGGTRSDLRTRPTAFLSAGEDVHRVEFRNSRSTRTLKVSKKQVGGDPGRFPFRLQLAGLTSEAYFAVIPGDASARITSRSDGTIQVRVTGSAFLEGKGGDLSGIPVRIIRCDREERTLYTDREGRIEADEYIHWIMEEKESHEYTIEFLKNTYTVTW